MGATDHYVPNLEKGMALLETIIYRIEQYDLPDRALNSATKPDNNPNVEKTDMGEHRLAEDEEQAIEILKERLGEIERLRGIKLGSKGKFSRSSKTDPDHTVTFQPGKDDPEFKEWWEKTKVDIREVFGEDSDDLRQFEKMFFDRKPISILIRTDKNTPRRSASISAERLEYYEKDLESARAFLQAKIHRVECFGLPDPTPKSATQPDSNPNAEKTTVSNHYEFNESTITGAAIGNAALNARDITSYNTTVESLTGFDAESKQALKEIRAMVEGAKVEQDNIFDALYALDGLVAELAKPKRNESRLKRLWGNIVDVVPDVINIATAVAPLAAILLA
ncbi:MAG TPA: hypothetical protein ENF16_01240 [Bacteroidetes bacterium]|nr:hypothetical protein [Bacteroidota bacterium]